MTTSQHPPVHAAARNNALWCAAMSRTHGVTGRFADEAWASPVRTPLYYPDAVTLAPGAGAAALVARIDTDAPGATVKDSFGDLDLSDAGFRVLFEARWIHRPAGASGLALSGAALSWDVVTDQETLRSWALAWDDDDADLFRPALLDVPDVHVIAGRDAEGQVTSGAVLNRGADAVGVSNVFSRGTGTGTDIAWSCVLDAAHQLYPGLPVVGYEHGDDLATALRHGFEAVGPLRIWLKP
ncbi:hypothetical protein GTY65_39350 [Streptomyces sp. SID8379]|uniref:hypothetical protein n=1 Tax=unclassified Streptomyces TaxID=2593676 RepID=UPI00035DAEBE|nr:MULTISPECIES: hypothetical protein [unclassified Streptomyces]MYW70070.1 hypothetical protein [Streptomyces sp. SID8379]